MKFPVFGTPFLLIILLSGCGSAIHSSAPAASYDLAPREVITMSLFDSKDRTISEEDIHRLLDGRIVIGDTVRIAVFKHASASINRYYTNWWTDEEYLKTQQSFVDTLVHQIRLSRKVKKVIPVPALMTGTNPGITQLRETAVRLQADLLIVYSVSSDIYFRYKVFQKNEAKAFATCETILMDVRTGVIPHSSIVTKEKLLAKGDQDLNDAETRKKAERDAILMSLADTGKGILKFLDAE
jgi:hypothetical protein